MSTALEPRPGQSSPLSHSPFQLNQHGRRRPPFRLPYRRLAPGTLELQGCRIEYIPQGIARRRTGR